MKSLFTFGIVKKRSEKISLKQPVHPILREIKIDYGKLFSSLAKCGKDVVLQDWPKVVAGLLGGGESVKLITDVGELAHLLIERSLIRALVEVVGETNFRSLFGENRPASPGVIRNVLSASSTSIDRSFFERPIDLDVVKEVRGHLKEWLTHLGVTEASASTIAKRFPSYFQLALVDEWRKNASHYDPILIALESPFAKAGDRELGWRNYNAYLQQQINRSVFDESFSLQQIYIPLNAYYVDTIKESSSDLALLEENDCRKRFVVSLHDELTSWVANPNKDDLLRVISGGPGSGKSTFARVFAAAVSSEGLARVLFVELHKIDASKDLPSEIARYVEDEGILSANPLDADDPEDNLIIILDGLDELSVQGRGAAENARAFVREVERTLRRKNEVKVRVRVLLSGRELIIQENESEFRGNRQTLNLLSYFRDEDMKRSNVEDPMGLLEKDLRQDWWRNYGDLTGDDTISGMPASLNRGGLREVTAQPLLNYLVALSYTRGRVNFDKAVNLNIVYADLVEAVYERGYDKNRRHVSVSHLTLDEFQRVLEEVALAAWHGDGRTTTVREINEHCVASNLQALLDKFEEGASAGVTRLLAAFFFRQHGERVSTGDRTFVFTHKSFGEFLAACRIVRAVERIIKQDRLREDSIEDGWGEKDSLYHWASVCGPAACTEYIRNFILGEFKRRSELSEKGFVSLRKIFICMLLHGIPMEKLNLKTFSQSLFQSRNAEETLLVALNAACISVSRVAYIDLPDTKLTAFGGWFRRIQGQRHGAKPCLAAKCLSYMGLKNFVLDVSDFYGADLSYSDLSGIDAHFSNFGRANLRHANLSNSNFTWAVFDNAMLDDANLRDSRFQYSNFTRRSEYEERGSKLGGASLRGADLSGASFFGADLSDSNLENVKIEGADFKKN